MRTCKRDYKTQFAKMPLSLLFLYTRLPDFPHEAVTVYGALVTLSNDKYGYAFPSQYELRKMCNLSKRKVTESIRVLRKYGLIRVERTMQNNRYYMTDPKFSTEDEFNAAYPKAYANYVERCAKVDADRQGDKSRQEKALHGDEHINYDF